MYITDTHHSETKSDLKHKTGREQSHSTSISTGY